MQKKLIKEYGELINQLVEVSCDEEWEEIIEFTDGNYDSAIIILKAKLKSKLFPYTNYDENENEEEIFYLNVYNEACSIAERNSFIWFMKDPMIFCEFIKFSVIDKLKKTKRR